MMTTKSGSLCSCGSRGRSVTETCRVKNSGGFSSKRNDKFEALPFLLSNLSAVLNDYLTSLCRQNPGRYKDRSHFDPTALA